MYSDVVTYLDRSIETLERLLHQQIADHRRTVRKPCSLSEYIDAIQSGQARLQVLRRVRTAIRDLAADEQVRSCRREALHYVEHGDYWAAVRGNARVRRLRREGFEAAASDLEAIGALAGHGRHALAA